MPPTPGFSTDNVWPLGTRARPALCLRCRNRPSSKMARGPARYAEPLISCRYQPACKPGSVGHRPLARTIRDGHSSGTTFARCLEQPTRTAGLTSPCGVIASQRTLALPSLFGLAPGVVCHAGSVAGAAVRSYRTFSPLPHPKKRRFVLCGTFPGVAPAGCYPAPYVDGARTFLSRSLSTWRERPSGRLILL